MSEAIRLIHLSGSPRERGVQYGQALGDEVSQYWSQAVGDLGSRVRPISESQLMKWVTEKAELALRAAPELEEEARGVAEGADVPYEVAVGVMFGEEVMDFGGREAGAWAPTTRCLSLSVPGSHTSTGNLLLGQTWDGPGWNPDPIILVIEEASGISAVMTDPGWNGGAGTNSHGLGSVHTGTLINDSPEGMPYPFISRRILQRSSVDEAVASVVEYPATAGCHYTVSDGRRTMNVEAAGSVSTTLPHDGLRSTAAHFNSPRAICKQALGVNPGAQMISRFRVARLLERAEQCRGLSPLEIFRLYDDHQEGPELGTVCMHPTPFRRGRTVGTLVVEPVSQTIWASAGNPCAKRPIRKVTLTDDGFETEVLHFSDESVLAAASG